MTNRAAIDSNQPPGADQSPAVPEKEAHFVERRAVPRVIDADDASDWESRALARVTGHLRNLPDEAQQPLGWEQTVIDVLRRRIEGGPQ
jgi:hypothetical protein